MDYVHEFCIDDKITFVNSESIPFHNINVHQIINDIENSNKIKKRKRKSTYKNLFEYFANCNKEIFTLKFKDFEKILGFKLCNSAYNHSCYWHRNNSNPFSNCWVDNGYYIQNLYLDKQKVVFKRKKKRGTVLEILTVLLSSNLPPDAKYELEHFFKFILKKYGL